jgi:2-amino-4-hydroxy-6-hydroxymethyldihydropteridine diphosphokinase
MARACIAVASNIEPEINIPRALESLACHVKITGLSTFYHTAPIDRPEQETYLNGAVAIETQFAPRKLKFEVLRVIEAALGRVRTDDRYAARRIDLDIATYGTLELREPELEIPDPDLRSRIFLATAVLELEPGYCLPGGQGSLSQYVDAAAKAALQPALEFSHALKERFLR